MLSFDNRSSARASDCANGFRKTAELHQWRAVEGTQIPTEGPVVHWVNPDWQGEVAPLHATLSMSTISAMQVPANIVI